MGEEEKTKKDEKFELVNVPIDYKQGIQTPTGEVLTVEQGIVLLLNEIKEMRVLLG